MKLKSYIVTAVVDTKQTPEGLEAIKESSKVYAANIVEAIESVPWGMEDVISVICMDVEDAEKESAA